jgi:hypothetical protein
MPKKYNNSGCQRLIYSDYEKRKKEKRQCVVFVLNEYFIYTSEHDQKEIFSLYKEQKGMKQVV